MTTGNDQGGHYFLRLHSGKIINRIALRLTGNDRGGHYFLSLHSGKRINRYTWTELPLPSNCPGTLTGYCGREI